MTHHLPDITDRKHIVHLVHTFYSKVREDKLIGPVFAAVVEDWEPHLEKMVSFWASTLLGEGSYRGAPFPKHLALDIGKAHFERWLSLFNSVLDEEFEGPRTEEACERATTIGHIFSHKIEMLKGTI